MKDTVMAGPDIEWGLFFSVPKEVTIIRFVDDLDMVVVAKYSESVEVYANETTSAIRTWVEMNQLDPAEQKTEAVWITYYYLCWWLYIITSKSIIKHLRMMIEAKINLKRHLGYV